MQIDTIQFESEDEAIEHINASSRGKAILLGGESMVVLQEDADRRASSSRASASTRCRTDRGAS